MDTKPIWDLLSGITIGRVIAWVFVIGAIVSALCAGTIKLYKVFTKYKELKDKEERQTKTVESHEAALRDNGETLKEISKRLGAIEEAMKVIESHEGMLKEYRASLDAISKSLEEQKDVNLKQIRHTIVHTCEDALERGEISINKLRSLEEMYQEYTDVFHGNSYVTTLVKRTRQLPIIGKTEE